MVMMATPMRSGGGARSNSRGERGCGPERTRVPKEEERRRKYAMPKCQASVVSNGYILHLIRWATTEEAGQRFSGKGLSLRSGVQPASVQFARAGLGGGLNGIGPDRTCFLYHTYFMSNGFTYVGCI